MKKYDINEVIDTLQESATEALKDGGTSEWGHRTLQIVEWLKELQHLRMLVEYSKGFNCTIEQAEIDLLVEKAGD